MHTQRSLQPHRPLQLADAFADFAPIAIVIALALLVGFGCSSADPAIADGTDASGETPDAGEVERVDAGPDFDGGPDYDAGVEPALDAGMLVAADGGLGFADAGEMTVAITGWILGADATERDLDASVSGLDGGVPAGGAATPGGRIYGVAVVLRDARSGAELSRTLTDSRGFYSLRGPASTVVFQEVEPVPGYLGVIRAEEVRATDYEAYDIFVPLRVQTEETATLLGIAYDATLGLVGVGFNPVTPDRGGEGVELGAGIVHAPPVNLAAGGVIMTNILPPLCSALGGETVAYPGGPTCTTLDRSFQIHFLGTQLGFAPVSALSPPGGTCAVRYGLAAWLVRPDTYTVIHIDCA